MNRIFQIPPVEWGKQLIKASFEASYGIARIELTGCVLCGDSVVLSKNFVPDNEIDYGVKAIARLQQAIQERGWQMDVKQELFEFILESDSIARWHGVWLVDDLGEEQS